MNMGWVKGRLVGCLVGIRTWADVCVSEGMMQCPVENWSRSINQPLGLGGSAGESFNS